MTSHTSNFNESKSIQDELQLNEQRFRDFAEAASDWFFEMDKDLRFTYVSKRHQEVIGVGRLTKTVVCRKKKICGANI